MKSNRVKALLLTLSLALLFTLAACTPEEAAESTELATAEETVAETEKKTNEMPESPVVDDEMSDEAVIKTGYSDEGPLKEMDKCVLTYVKSESDLAPFKGYIDGLTDEEIRTYLADTEGLCFVVEITQKTPKTYYSLDAIYRDIDLIYLEISEFADPEDETIQPAHTFYFFYISGESYDGENVAVTFLAE